MKVHIFRGDLSDTSDKTATLLTRSDFVCKLDRQLCYEAAINGGAYNQDLSFWDTTTVTILICAVKK